MGSLLSSQTVAFATRGLRPQARKEPAEAREAAVAEVAVLPVARHDSQLYRFMNVGGYPVLDGRVSGFWRSLWLECDSHHENAIFKIVDLGVGARSA